MCVKACPGHDAAAHGDPAVPPSVGGIQTYVLGLARALARRCEAFTVMAPMALGVDDSVHPYPIVRVPPGQWAMPASCAIAVPIVARHGRFDACLHVEWTTAHASLLARRTGWPRRVFVAAHGLEVLRLRPDVPVLRTLLEARRDHTFARVDRFFPVSAFTAELLRRAGVDADRLQVVHNGVDAIRFRPLDRAEARRRLGLGDVPTLLTVGRLVPRKGVDLVLLALPEVRRRFGSVRYVVAGDGPDRGRLEALARELGVREAVELRGRVPDEDVAWLYAACDAFVLPVRDEWPSVEGFGLVYLEASACERPVIGARAGGAPEAVREGETGLLVEPDDVRGLAAAITGLLEDPSRARELGRRGREVVLETATWERVADRMLASMCECLRA